MYLNGVFVFAVVARYKVTLGKFKITGWLLCSEPVLIQQNLFFNFYIQVRSAFEACASLCRLWTSDGSSNK